MFTETAKQSNRPFPINTGYIAIPEGVSRDNYITNCYRKERLSIMAEQGGFMVHDCYISKEAIKNVRFPADSKTLGSPVVYVYTAISTKPIIIACVSEESETELLEEGKFKLDKIFGGNRVQVIGNAKNGNLYLNVETYDDNTSDIIVNLSSKKDTNLKVTLNGTTEIHSTKEFKVKTEKFNIGKATEPIVLADSLISLLSDILDEIASSTTSTMLGAQPLLNAVNISAFKDRLDEIKSLTTKSS